MYILNVDLGERSYSVYIKTGIFSQLGAMLEKITSAKKVAIITDSNVERHYGKEIINILKSSDFDVLKVVVKAGEKSKSMATLVKVYSELLNCNISRQDCILALGGGVVGDLAGFAAATFLRGIPYFQIPTSLLAQVDSSIGGKVAIDLPEGKNLVGSFYQPKAVFIDSAFLETLKPKFFYDGMAEVIKYGCIKDGNLFEKLMLFQKKDDLRANIEEIILRCLEIKKALVEQDESDIGNRMFLNFGHTFGHAIEKHYSYKKYTHGQAVAIGMYQITKNSEQLGITRIGTSDKIKEILKKYNLPCEIPLIDVEKVIESIVFDKKNRGKNIDIVVLNKIGNSLIKRVDFAHLPRYFL